jgi:hypothetical protein
MSRSNRSGYYAYKGNAPLEKAPHGTLNQGIRRDLKTDRGALRWARDVFGPTFRLFHFTEFYDNETFKEVAQ